MLSVFVTVAALSSSLVVGDINILATADWGGQSNSPYYTSDEKDTAKVMGEVASNHDAKIAWMFGDNFYNDGVKNEDDKRFQETFEDVFTASSLKNLPFWFVGGNHDHYGNITGEIEYSHKNSRWNFPAKYYTQTWDVPDTSWKIQLVMIDTYDLCGNVYSRDYCVLKNISEADCNLQPLGPENVAAAESQWDWITNTLKASTADFLVVAGHYPVWSIAEHGPTSCLVNQLRPLLIQYDVTYYMSGHDHTFEFLVEESYPNLHYMVVGGAHTCDSSTAHKDNVPKDSLKFHGCDDGGLVRVNVNSDNDGIQTSFYYGDSSSHKYRTPFIKPRKHS